MDAHTPGGWNIMEGKTLLHIETDADNTAGAGIPICSIPKSKKANAFLLHAAPDLLTALVGLLQTGLAGADDYRLCLIACSGKELTPESLKAAEDFGNAVNVARAAIARAEGRAE